MLSTKIRMLAAIMFTDMVGYTALMQVNEQKAKSLRDKQRKVLDEKIFEHKGQILQYYGDGTLSVFGSVIEAALCAIEIQDELQKEPVVPIRIGIHVGDIVYDDEGVYGDAVNVAARLENLSAAGAVLVSEKVYDEIKNQENLDAVSLGSYELKNVKKPVEIFALSSGNLVIPSLDDVKRKSDSSDFSVAVLPFVNMSADPENEYFSDGITEEILNALSKTDGLLVTSRTSSFAFKGKNEDIRQIGNQLGVKTVLEGSVRKIGNRVRITAQLIDTKDGYHKWSETYDRNLEDIFAVQDEISRTIAEQLSSRFSVPDLAKPLLEKKTINVEAYNLVLKGRYYWNKWTPDDIKIALKYFEEANKIDPDYAMPYVGMSNCYLYLGAISSHHYYPKAKEMAIKALEKDGTFSGSHISLALVNMFYEHNFSEAEKSFLKALELNPGIADAHYTYSMMLATKNRLTEALSHAEDANKLDPLSLPINEWYATVLYYMKRYDEAINQHLKTIELDPTFRGSFYGLGFIYLSKGEYDKAIDYLLKAKNYIRDDLKGITPLGYAYAVSGEITKAKECLNKLLEREKRDDNEDLEMDLAVIYAGLKDYDKTFSYLEKAYAKRDGGIIFLNVHPEWIRLKSDPRFQSLIKKVGLA